MGSLLDAIFYAGNAANVPKLEQWEKAKPFLQSLDIACIRATACSNLLKVLSNSSKIALFRVAPRSCR